MILNLYSPRRISEGPLSDRVNEEEEQKSESQTNSELRVSLVPLSSDADKTTSAHNWIDTQTVKEHKQRAFGGATTSLKPAAHKMYGCD